MYVCICVMYVCMSHSCHVFSHLMSVHYTHTYIHTYTHTHTGETPPFVLSINTSDFNHGQLHQCIHTYIHTYIHTPTHTQEKHRPLSSVSTQKTSIMINYIKCSRKFHPSNSRHRDPITRTCVPHNKSMTVMRSKTADV
jgi:hypothetical protein